MILISIFNMADTIPIARAPVKTFVARKEIVVENNTGRFEAFETACIMLYQA